MKKVNDIFFCIVSSFLFSPCLDLNAQRYLICLAVCTNMFCFVRMYRLCNGVKRMDGEQQKMKIKCMKRELNDKNEIDDKNIKNIFRILIICVFIVVVPRVIYVRKWFFFKKISWSEIQLLNHSVYTFKNEVERKRTTQCGRHGYCLHNLKSV